MKSFILTLPQLQNVSAHFQNVGVQFQLLGLSVPTGGSECSNSWWVKLTEVYFDLQEFIFYCQECIFHLPRTQVS